MTSLILLTKINDASQLKQIKKALTSSLDGLEVEATVLGTVAGGWVQLSLAGEDEEVAKNYLIQEIGVCPTNFENVGVFSILKGYVSNLGKNGGELSVDVGIFEPKTVHANISLRHLQEVLVDGNTFSLRKIAELFGFCNGLPLSVRVSKIGKVGSHIDAELSSEQIMKYKVWRDSLLDRLLILESSLENVNAIIKRLQLERDVVGVESLGMLEHSLSCKLGTDAAGLIPKIGRHSKNVRFSVFSPKKLRNVLEDIL